MAHPYTKVERVRSLLSRARALDLLDRDGDQREDSGTPDTNSTAVIDAEIERACNEIDAALSVRYPLPFAAITANPATPPRIADICDWLVADFVYSWKAPGGAEAKYWREKWGDALGALAKGDHRLVDANGAIIAPIDPTESTTPIAYESTGTKWAGVTDPNDMEQNETSTGAVSQSRGF